MSRIRLDTLGELVWSGLCVVLVPETWFVEDVDGLTFP